ncbi:MAG: TetR/AcrR family transcriptional regulator [Thermoanaerobaculia bacterium]|nr:TetR/AcrR family transcriptional regulator [Thermoanaerobaculia bacterium]
MTQEPLTERQQQVVDLALEVVRESGLRGLTVRKLAEEVGFSEAALYKHFSSKRALLLAMARQMSERRLLGPIRRLVESEGDPSERLESVLSHHVGTILETDALPILLLAEAAASGDEELLEVIGGTLEELLARMEELVAEIPASPDRPPPDQLALLLFGLPAAVALSHRLRPDPETERAAAGPLGRYLVRRLVGGEGEESTDRGMEKDKGERP